MNLGEYQKQTPATSKLEIRVGNILTLISPGDIMENLCVESWEKEQNPGLIMGPFAYQPSKFYESHKIFVKESNLPENYQTT